MLKNKIKFIVFALLILVIGFLIINNINNNNKEKEARKVLNEYLTSVNEGDYSSAYRLISDMDKKNISEELFKDWRETVGSIVKCKSFDIEKKCDNMKNYDYLGIVYDNAFGYNVLCEQEILKENIETSDYDQKSFKIMVIQENGTFKVALFLEDLIERVDKYKIAIEEQ